MTRFSIVRTEKSKVIRKFIYSLFAAVFWLLVWHLGSLAVGRELILPSPAATFGRLAALLPQKDFLLASGMSLLRTACGFFAGSLFGIIVAVFSARYELVRVVTSPLLKTVKATPVASFILLALVLINSRYMPAFISFLMVLPIVWENVSGGILSTDVKLLEMAKVFKFSKLKTVRLIYYPWVRPYAAAAFKISVGLAWKASVAAEVIGVTKYSLGGNLYYSKIYLETPDLFALTVFVIILSVAMEKLIIFLLRGH